MNIMKKKGTPVASYNNVYFAIFRDLQNKRYTYYIYSIKIMYIVKST